MIVSSLRASPLSFAERGFIPTKSKKMIMNKKKTTYLALGITALSLSAAQAVVLDVNLAPGNETIDGVNVGNQRDDPANGATFGTANTDTATIVRPASILTEPMVRLLLMTVWAMWGPTTLLSSLLPAMRQETPSLLLNKEAPEPKVFPEALFLLPTNGGSETLTVSLSFALQLVSLTSGNQFVFDGFTGATLALVMVAVKQVQFSEQHSQRCF